MNRLLLDITLAATDDVDHTIHAGLAAGAGSLGCERVGALGFLRRLAKVVGVPWVPAAMGERVAVADRLLHGLDDARSWFSASRLNDRFGVAGWMVTRVDGLRRAGWTGSAPAETPRLVTLSVLDAGLPAGESHLGHRVLDRLRTLERLPFAMRVQVEGDEAGHDGLTRSVLVELRRLGVSVTTVEWAANQSTTDLGRLQAALTRRPSEPLVGDGTVRILVADTPWEAAEAVAALARAEGRDPAWVVSSEPSVLEQARRRQGLPALGLSEGSIHRPILQVLPLALELQFWPQDPSVAHQLLTLPVRPIRSKLARALSKALLQRPGIGNEAWGQALDEGVGLLASARVEESTCTDQRRRVTLLFPELHLDRSERVAVPRVAAIASEIAAWSEGRARMGGEEAEDLAVAARVARDLVIVLGRLPPEQTLGRLEVRQLFELVAAPGRPRDGAEASAPPASCDPAGLPVGSRDVAWWGAVAGVAELGPDEAWTAAERTALVEAGCGLLDAGARRLSEHRRWLWPVLTARERFLAVMWRNNGTDAAEPHPMFDAWRAAVGPASMTACKVEARALRVPGSGVPSSTVNELPSREPAVVWTLPEGAVTVRRALSATSIEKMLECPLQWTFQNGAGLTPGAASRRSDERAAIGAFAHLLLQELVLYPNDVAFDSLTPEEAARRVEVAFDARVGAEAATLVLPGNAATLARTRRHIVDAAPALVRALRAGGWWPVLEAEASFSGRFAGHETSGRADLVVARADGARAVIDIKLGGGRPDGKLRSGTALQLAVYAQGFGTEGRLARGAYFIVEDGRLLSADPDAFPAPSWHVPGPPLGEAFLDAERAWTWWEDVVRSGVVAAIGKAEDGTLVGAVAEILSKEPFDGPWRDARPYCAWCDQRRICAFTVRAELPDVDGSTTEGGEA